MLVLSRHKDEVIMLGDDIVLTVVDIRGDKVRLGIDAPQEIPVHRKEVYDAIKRENLKKLDLKEELEEVPPKEKTKNPMMFDSLKQRIEHQKKQKQQNQ